ncbi:hypothetical protein RUR49_06840 [Pseudoxanthobacter sp. M-2]|uniref:hypothetical protein n=1 Tax=Pseudoxanthobacter sp. M-2 TaxID=3078754 RepID=UPI0038FC7BB0
MKQTADTSEAVTYATEILQRMRTEKIDTFCGVEVAWLGDKQSRRFVIEMIKKFSRWRPENLMDAVDRARGGWSVADEALREMILEDINSGRPLPTYLAAYNMEIVGGRIPMRQGKQKADYFLRDIAVMVAIILVIERFNLPPYSRDGRNPCACAVVSDALFNLGMGRGYKAIAEIWRRNRHNAGAPYDGQGVLK